MQHHIFHKNYFRSVVCCIKAFSIRIICDVLALHQFYLFLSLSLTFR